MIARALIEQRRVAEIAALRAALTELVEICRVKVSPLDEVILVSGKSNHDALVGAVALLEAPASSPPVYSVPEAQRKNAILYRKYAACSPWNSKARAEWLALAENAERVASAFEQEEVWPSRN